MTDDSPGRVTLADIWKVLTELTRTVNEHDRMIASNAERLENAIQGLQQMQRLAERTVERLEKAGIEEVKAASVAANLGEAVREMRARLQLLEVWRNEHEVWSRERDRDLRAVIDQTKTLLDRMDALDRSISEARQMVREHVESGHISAEDRKTLHTMADGERKRQSERGILNSEFRRLLIFGPLTVIGLASATVIGGIVEHVLHLFGRGG